MTSRTASNSETSRLTITWSKECNFALRTFFGTHGLKKRDISKFIEEAVRRYIFHQTVRHMRTVFANVPPDKLQRMIDEGVKEVRAKHCRARARRS
jgi:hypothetical protein